MKLIKKIKDFFPRASFFDLTIQSVEELNWFWGKKPSRLEALQIYFLKYVRKFAFHSRDSWPYISGDAFASISDLVIMNKGDLLRINHRDVQDARVIFIQADLFELFLDEFRDLVSVSKVLITGNSDRNFFRIPCQLDGKDFVWFAQNSFILGDSRVHTIPIGIENIKLGVHGRLRHLVRSSSFDQTRILFGPMGNTHVSRVEHLAAAIQFQNVFCIPPRRVKPRVYVKQSSKFKYVFCPQGNGVDTHRFWETLYRGQTPVIIKSAWAASLSKLNLPIIQVSNLDELISIAPNLHFDRSDFNSEELEVLWMPYWKTKIQEILKLDLA